MDMSAHPKDLCFNRGSATPFSFCYSISKCTRFEVLTELLTKVQGAWVVTLLWLVKITDISKGPTAFVFEVKQAKENHSSCTALPWRWKHDLSKRREIFSQRLSIEFHPTSIPYMQSDYNRFLPHSFQFIIPYPPHPLSLLTAFVSKQ